MPGFFGQREQRMGFGRRREAQASAEQHEIGEVLHVREQWAQQLRVLTAAQIVDYLPNSHGYGITGADGEEYKLPSADDVEQAINNRERIVREKVSQGFERLILVPQGLPLLELINRYSQRLRVHAQQGTLLSTDGTALQLDTQEPMWVEQVYRGTDGHGADATGELKQFPTSFNQRQQSAFTSQELLKKKQAWQILLVEKTVDIPAANKAITVGGRTPFAAGSSPEEYLKMIQTDPQYKHEQGLTIHDWLALALTQLEETNQQIDDLYGSGKGCWLLGSTINGEVPRAYWYRRDQQANLFGDLPDSQYSNVGVRTAVNISLLNL